MVQAPSQQEWHVDIESHGRAGVLTYVEGGGAIPFEWEFCTGPLIAEVWSDLWSVWDSRYPWAAGRRVIVLERVAMEVVRQKASHCRAAIDASAGRVSIVAPAV